MLVSLKWLRDYVATPREAKSLAERFRLTSSEVDTIHDLAAPIAGLVVGKVLSVADHPSSTQLHVAEVSVGTGKLSIVCGAPNLAAGQTVVVAPVGTTIYPVGGEPLTIGERVIRGVPSQGMLCAPEEIGFALPSQGIWELPGSFEEGAPFAVAAGFDDAILDLEITPNRPDLLSYVGLAREVAAFDRLRLSEPPLASQLDEGSFSQPSPRADIADSRLCSRYCAVAVSGNLAQASPWWLQRHLISVGQKPINLIVDCTNFVMRETGQPMHAFSLGTDQAQQLRVRGAAAGESLVLLDGSTRQLEPGDIVVADAQAPLALAGIMGGESTAIQPETTVALLESATFSAPAVRRTSRRLGLRTEASNRFEKGLDPELALTALKRLIWLLQQSGIAVASPLFDHYPQASVAERPRIHLTFARLHQLAGVSIAPAECRAILQRLGCTVVAMSKSAIEVTPPSWRHDLRIPEDVIEEIIRIWGFERIPVGFPSGPIKPPARNERFERGYAVRRALAACGAQETVHLPFVSAQQLSAIGTDPASAVALAYPLSVEQAYLAPSRLIPLLTTVATRYRTEPEQRLFEISQAPLPTGQHAHQLSIMIRTAGTAEDAVRELKGMLVAMGEALVIPELATTPVTGGSEYPYYPTNGAAAVFFGGTGIGQLGILRQSVLDAWKIRKSRTVLYANLDIEPLLAAAPQFPTVSPESPFQAVERDLTLSLAESARVGDVLAALGETPSPEASRTIELTTLYRTNDGDTRKSATFHITYAPLTRTLTEADITADLERLGQAITLFTDAH